MANVALVSLKKFRNSAADFYDQMIAHVISGMAAADSTPQDSPDDITTPELEKILEQLQAAPAGAPKGLAAAPSLKATKRGAKGPPAKAPKAKA